MLGPYEVLDPVGAGGMGEVYRARDTRLGRVVAIKLIRAEFGGREDFRLRFEREARANSALNHPNICSVYDVGEHEGHAYLVMEYIEGETLASCLKNGPLSAETASSFALQIADALIAAHAAGIVHRDLKPANVKITGPASGDPSRVKVLDFGLAKTVEPEPQPGINLSEALTVTATEGGKIVGTPGYMSPEQALGKSIDTRSDIWAFGCILYEMLTGQRAFKGETATDTIAKVLEREPDWQPLPTSTPSAVRDLIRQCLEKDPSRRPPDMRTVRARLAAGARGWQPSRQLLLALAAVLVLAVLAALRPLVLKERLSGPATAIRSIAVLPLANYSGDAGQEFFVDGMTDELTSDLSKLGALRVISRTSAMNYKGTRKPLKTIAKELGVDAVVEGSVLRSGQKVRIVAQLIDAANDRHMWSETYDREVQDVLRMQSEVAQAIAREIKVAVTPEEKARLASARTVNPEAYELYLKAMFFINKMTPDGFDKGVAYLQQAVDKDPSDPFAYAALALGWGIIGHDRFPDALPKAKAAARRSLELGGDVPLAYLALGMSEQYFDWDAASAAKHFQRALELNPNLAEARRHVSWLLRLMGRPKDGLAEMKRAAELEPLDPLFPADYGWQLHSEHQLDAAMVQIRKSLELDPKFTEALSVQGFILADQGKFEEALAAHRAAAAADAEWKWPLAMTWCRMGRKDEALKIAAELKKKPGPMDQWALAVMYAAMGENDESLHWLEEAWKSRFSWVPWVLLDHGLVDGPVRNDPRFKAMVSRLGPPPSPNLLP